MPAFEAASSTLSLPEMSVDEFEDVITAASDGVAFDATTGSGVCNATN